MTDNFSLEKRIFDASAISDYMGCPKYFQYVWVRRLESKEGKPAMTFGTVWHDVMKVWYKTGDPILAAKELKALPSVITDTHLTKEWGEAIFKQYVERYPVDKEPGVTLYLEKQFHVEIGEKIYSGRIDRIEDWNGKIYVDDHKTSKSLGLSFFNNYRPSVQIDGYCYACREICGGCHGAIINGISTAKNPKERFQRFPSARMDKELDEFKTVFTQWTDDIEASVIMERWPKNWSYCNRWGKCKFWEACVYGEDPKWIEQNFTVKPMEEEKK